MNRLKILMYHSIGEPGEPGRRFVLPHSRFERQLVWLERARYHVVALGAALDLLRTGEPLPARAVALTFDDGTFDVAQLAYPLLQQHAFPATLFVVTGAMGGVVTWTEEPGLVGRRVLTWSEALALEPLVSLAPHSRTHPLLPNLDDLQLVAELAGSRADLEARTRRRATAFAYPYGRYDSRVAAAAASSGYRAACTVVAGVNTAATRPHELRRYEVRGDEPAAAFALELASDGAYRGIRRLRRMLR